MRRLMWFIVLSAVLHAGFPCFAAGAWPVPSSGGILVGFGDTYVRAAGGQAVHRGIDVGAPAGSQVRAAESGTVSFAGLVPGEGGQILAVSVKTAQGLTVTCLPFDIASVSAGDDVAAGDVLGTLAESGDGSSPLSHVHLSLRREQLYLDPTVLLGAEAASSTGPVMGAAPPSPVEPAHAVQPNAPAPVGGEAVFTAANVVVPQTAGRVGDRPVSADAGEVARHAPVESPASRSAEMDPRAEQYRSSVRPSVSTGIPAPAAAHNSASVARAAGKMNSIVRLNHNIGARDSVLVVIASCLAAAAGLWPLWRPRSNQSLISCVRPTLDNLAAAVGR